MTLNLDFDEPGGQPDRELQQRVLDKLTKMEIDARNLIAADGYASVLEHFNAFSLPAVLIFGTDGKLKEKFEGDVTYERDVVPLVRQLLDKSREDLEAP